MKLTIRTLKRLIKEATQTPNESNVVVLQVTRQDGMVIHPPSGAAIYVDNEMDDEYGEGASWDMDAERAELIHQAVQNSGALFVYDAEGYSDGSIPWTTSDGENVKVWPISDWLSMYHSAEVTRGRPKAESVRHIPRKR